MVTAESTVPQQTISTNFSSKASAIFNCSNPLPVYSKTISLDTSMCNTIRKWQDIFRKLSEMSNSWSKKVFLAANKIILAKHRDLLFTIFISNKIILLLCTTFIINFLKNDSRKMLRNIANKKD